MSTPIPIDASQARNNFFKLLQRVYDHRESFIIKKAGIPMATIKTISDEPTSPKNVMDFAGAWKDKINASKLIKQIYRDRKDDPKLQRKLPVLK